MSCTASAVLPHRSTASLPLPVCTTHPQVTIVNAENGVFAHWVDHASLLGELAAFLPATLLLEASMVLLLLLCFSKPVAVAGAAAAVRMHCLLAFLRASLSAASYIGLPTQALLRRPALLRKLPCITAICTACCPYPIPPSVPQT
jgi:hypothetical protein